MSDRAWAWMWAGILFGTAFVSNVVVQLVVS